MNLDRLVVVDGLPRDAKHDELQTFFNRFSSIERIEIVNGNGRIHLRFRTNFDAEEFVRKSRSRSIIYSNEYVRLLCNGFTLVCRMFDEQRKSTVKSNSCATEQILFCQNSFDRKSSKFVDFQRENLVKNSFNYEFYYPEHLLHQTHDCVIIAALNPHCFTIQLKQDAIEFDKFQREINDFYNEIDDSKYFVRLNDIRLDLCVVSLDKNSTTTTNDRIWNRAQILEFDSQDETVNLFYVDLGTWDEYVPIDRLRFLIERFHRHSVFSLNCRLAHLTPFNEQNDRTIWPNDATQQFLAVLDRTSPQIEFISFDRDRSFQTNLFVVYSGHFVCVNDYLIHIKKARPMLQPLNIDENSQIHPVVSLYLKLGETLKRSSNTISHNHQQEKPLIKFISLLPSSDDSRPKDSKRLPLLFVYFQRKIFVPDANIYILLQTIQTNIDRKLIENYATVLQYQPVEFTRTSHNELFTRLNSIFDLRSVGFVRCYSIDFVYSLLERYRCRNAHIYYALDKAKRAEMFPNDLRQWFRTDNEFDDFVSVDKRLPFSNRSIGVVSNKIF